MMPVFRMLAKLRFLRGTPLDIFGYSADRKLERDLIAGYEKDVATVLGLLSPVDASIPRSKSSRCPTASAATAR